MKKFFLAACLLLASCSHHKTNKSVVVITNLSVGVSMGTHYVFWVGIQETGKPVGGFETKFVDIRLGDVFDAEQYDGDNLWKLKARISANR